jgi:flagellar basal-body rod protein FlgC
MSSTLSIAASGLAAAFQRLQVSANNVANADSDGPTTSASAADQAQYQPAQYASAYVAQQVNQVATPAGGTSAVVSNVQPGTVTAYDPTAAYADQNGDVSAPNVDIATELIQQAIASYAFAANAAVINAQQQTMQSLLNIQT